MLYITQVGYSNFKNCGYLTKIDNTDLKQSVYCIFKEERYLTRLIFNSSIFHIH